MGLRRAVVGVSLEIGIMLPQIKSLSVSWQLIMLNMRLDRKLYRLMAHPMYYAHEHYNV